MLNDTFTYQTDTDLFTQAISTGYLKKYKSLTEFDYVNGFSSVATSTRQMVLKQYTSTDIKNNNFEIDAYKKAGDLNDLIVHVYLDNKLKINNTTSVTLNLHRYYVIMGDDKSTVII